MSDHRRRASMIAVGAASMALLASPVATFAQDGDPMASVGEACQAANLDEVLKNAGRLTVSTDNPGYFPWFTGTVPEGSDWASYGGYPPSGEGFESAMAYAIGEALGFSSDQVEWIGQIEFGLAYTPGDKDFDFHLGQVTITEPRKQAVDFSDSYYEATQSVVALAGSPINEATTLEELKDFRLAAPGNTTSFRIIEDVIQPNVEPRAPQDVSSGTQQLFNGQIDGLVVDTPSAFYIRDGILPFEPYETEGYIVGQVTEVGDEMFGAVLEKDSLLTACVSEAIAAVRAGDQYQVFIDTWIDTDSPILQ